MSHFNNVEKYKTYITGLLNISTDDKTTLQAILDDINNTEITIGILDVIRNTAYNIEGMLSHLRISKSDSYRIYFKTQSILYIILNFLSQNMHAKLELDESQPDISVKSISSSTHSVSDAHNDSGSVLPDLGGGRRKKTGSKKQSKTGSKKKGSKTGSKKKKSKRLSKRRSKKKGSKK